MSKPHAERKAAAVRLASERTFPLATLKDVAGLTVDVLKRYGMEGRLGIYLDLVLEPERGWCSSVEAVRRCLTAIEAEKARRAMAQHAARS